MSIYILHGDNYFNKVLQREQIYKPPPRFSSGYRFWNNLGGYSGKYFEFGGEDNAQGFIDERIGYNNSKLNFILHAPVYFMKAEKPDRYYVKVDHRVPRLSHDDVTKSFIVHSVYKKLEKFAMLGPEPFKYSANLDDYRFSGQLGALLEVDPEKEQNFEFTFNTGSAVKPGRGQAFERWIQAEEAERKVNDYVIDSMKNAEFSVYSGLITRATVNKAPGDSKRYAAFRTPAGSDSGVVASIKNSVDLFGWQLGLLCHIAGDVASLSKSMFTPEHYYDEFGEYLISGFPYMTPLSLAEEANFISGMSDFQIAMSHFLIALFLNLQRGGILPSLGPGKTIEYFCVSESGFILPDISRLVSEQPIDGASTVKVADVWRFFVEIMKKKGSNLKDVKKARLAHENLTVGLGTGPSNYTLFAFSEAIANSFRRDDVGYDIGITGGFTQSDIDKYLRGEGPFQDAFQFRFYH